MRTREVWIHAVDLNNGATFADIPAAVLERLLTDITGAWHTRGTDAGLLVKVTDRDLTFGDLASGTHDHCGPLAAVVEWAAGRGHGGVTAPAPAPLPQTAPLRPPRSGFEPSAALNYSDKQEEPPHVRGLFLLNSTAPNNGLRRG